MLSFNGNITLILLFLKVYKIFLTFSLFSKRKLGLKELISMLTLRWILMIIYFLFRIMSIIHCPSTKHDVYPCISFWLSTSLYSSSMLWTIPIWHIIQTCKFNFVPVKKLSFWENNIHFCLEADIIRFTQVK